MTTSFIGVKEQSPPDKRAATHEISEDAVDKQIGRVNLNDSAGADILGSKTDAKSTATDTTSVSAISIWKQISQSVQDMATTLSGTISTVLSNILSAITGGYTIVNGQNLNVEVFGFSGYTTLVSITNTKAKELMVQFTVADQALFQFQILAKCHEDAPWLTYGVDGNSWIDPDAEDSNIAAGSRILETTGDLGAVVAGGNGGFAMNITGLVEIAVQAAAVADSATVSTYYSLHR